MEMAYEEKVSGCGGGGGGVFSNERWFSSGWVFTKGSIMSVPSGPAASNTESESKWQLSEKCNLQSGAGTEWEEQCFNGHCCICGAMALHRIGRVGRERARGRDGK